MTKLSQDPYASIIALSKSFREKSLLPSDVIAAQLNRIESVSYTHLTLPTNREV